MIRLRSAATRTAPVVFRRVNFAPMITRSRILTLLLLLIALPLYGATRHRVTSHVSACQATIAPRAFNVPADGGTGTISVSQTANCRWAPNPTADWITINLISISEGLIVFTAEANPDLMPRTASIEIAGAFVVITQAARVQPNLLTNGSFDRDLTGWATTFSTGTGSAIWSSLDANGSSTSGSARITSTQAQTGYQLLECINVEAGKLYEYGVKVRIPSGQDALGRMIIGVYEYDVPDCNKVGYFSSYSAEVRQPFDAWVPYASTFPATAVTKSIYLVIAAGGQRTPTFAINIDDAYLRPKP
jgi:hypothetical protein